MMMKTKNNKKESKSSPVHILESKFKLLVDLKDTSGEDLNKLYDMLNEEFRETFRMLSYLKYEAEQQ